MRQADHTGQQEHRAALLVGLMLSGRQQVGHMNTSLRGSERSWNGGRGFGEMKGGGGVGYRNTEETADGEGLRES